MNRKRIPYGTKLPVFFSSKELEDIRKCIMIGEEFGNKQPLRVDLAEIRW